MRGDDDLDDLLRVIGLRISPGSAWAIAGSKQSVLEPAQQPGPVTAADQHDRELGDLPGLHQGEGLEQLVQCAEPANGSTTNAWEYFTNMVLRTKK